MSPAQFLPLLLCLVSLSCLSLSLSLYSSAPSGQSQSPDARRRGDGRSDWLEAASVSASIQGFFFPQPLSLSFIFLHTLLFFPSSQSEHLPPPAPLCLSACVPPASTDADIMLCVFVCVHFLCTDIVCAAVGFSFF